MVIPATCTPILPRSTNAPVRRHYLLAFTCCPADSLTMPLCLWFCLCCVEFFGVKFQVVSRVETAQLRRFPFSPCQTTISRKRRLALRVCSVGLERVVVRNRGCFFKSMSFCRRHPIPDLTGYITEGQVQKKFLSSHIPPAPFFRHQRSHCFADLR